MKMITIKDDDSITTDLVEKLCLIELTQDAVLVVPHIEDKNILDFSHQFLLKNTNNIKPNNKNIYHFYPKLKMALPIGIYPNFETKIPGMNILQKKQTTLDGIELYADIPCSDDVDLKISAIKGEYIYYKDLNFYLNVFNRELFLNHIGLRSGLLIKEQYDIISLNLIKNFIGLENNAINELYIIKSNYIYERFPNL